MSKPHVIGLLDAISAAEAELDDIDKGPPHERRDADAYRFKGVIDAIRRARAQDIRSVERRYYDGMVVDGVPNPSGKADCDAHAAYLTSLGFAVTTRKENERMAAGIGDWGQLDDAEAPKTPSFRDAYVLSIGW